MEQPTKAPGILEIESLESAGFSAEEIESWRSEQAATLQDAGFSGKEIDDYFGIVDPDMSVLKKYTEENFKRAQASPTPAASGTPAPSNSGSIVPPTGAGISGIPLASAVNPEQADTLAESLLAGWQMSTTGLVARGQKPDVVLPEHAPTFYRIASQVSTLAGDVPAMLAGGVIGGIGGAAVGSTVPVVGTAVGGVLGAGGGANALPTAMREILMQHYEKGDVKSFSDFWERASVVAIESSKSFAVGAATMGVGAKVAKVAKPLMSPLAATATTAISEVATMTTVGKGLEGQVPEPQDFIDGALLVGFLGGTVKGAGKLREIYARTGMKPEQVVAESQSNPVLKQELLSDSPGIPKSLLEAVEPSVLGEMGIKEVKPENIKFKDPELGEMEMQPPKASPKKPIEEIPPASESHKKIRERIAGDRPPPKLDKEGMTELAHKAYENVVDALHPVERAVKSLTNGQELKAIDNPYLLLRNSKGDYGRFVSFIENGVRDFHTGKVVSKPLTKILEPVKQDVNSFEEFAIASRVLELQKRGIETGIDVADAQAVVGSGKGKYQKIFDELVDYQNQALKYLKDSEVLSPEAFAKMTEMNKSYIPFQRLMDDGKTTGLAGQTTSVKNPIKAIKGSERQLLSPLQTVVENVAEYVSIAERNRALLKLADLADASPEMGFMKKVPPERVPVGIKGEEIAKEFRERGIDLGDDVEGFAVFRTKSSRLADNEIAVFRNGKREVYEVEPGLARALKNMDAEASHLLVKIMGGATKTLKAGSVLSPDFMARNFSRDLMTAFNLAPGVFTPFDTLKGLGSLLKKDQHYYDWLSGGGANATFQVVDKNFLKTQVFKLDSEVGFMKNTWNVIKSPIELLALTGQLVENSTRIGQFKKVKASVGGKATDINVTYDAAFQSREVTLDFARMGAKTKSINQLVAFFNAQVQGLDKTARAFKDRPGETSLKVAASVTLPSIGLWWANYQDPRWKEIPRWQKDMFWIVMTDDWESTGLEEPAVGDGFKRQLEDGTWEMNKGNIFRIPKPQELGLIFGSIPERTLEAYFAENPNAFKDFENTMIEAFTPGMVPTAVVPVVEHWANKSMFTGRNLVPGHLEGILPVEQQTEYTTESGKILGKLVGTIFPSQEMKPGSFASPMVIENYIRGWSGSLGAYALQAADTALTKAGIVPDPVKPASTLADIPVIKAFAVRFPSAQAQSIQDFNDRFAKAEPVYKTIQHAAKSGDFEVVEKYATLVEEQGLVRLTEMRDALASQSKFIRMVYKNPDISPDEKRQLIDNLYMVMIETAKMGNQIMDQAEAEAKAAEQGE